MTPDEPLDLAAEAHVSTDDIAVGGRSTQIIGVVAALGLAALVAVGVASGGSSPAAPPSTTGPVETSAAPTTTTERVTTSIPPVSLVEQIEATSPFPIDASIFALDTNRDLVEIDIQTGQIVRHELLFDPGFLIDIAPFGDDVLLVGLDSTLLVQPDRFVSESIRGEPVAWDETSVWVRLPTQPDAAELVVVRSDKPPIGVAAPNFDIGRPTIDDGRLIVSSPTGVIGLATDGTVTTESELTHVRRGPTRVVTRCEGLICRPLVVHDDGREFEVPDGTTAGSIVLSWTGTLAVGGEPDDGWILSFNVDQMQRFIRPVGDVSWAYGADYLAISRDATIVLFDTAGLPTGPVGPVWEIELPPDTRPLPFLIVANGAF